MGNQHWLLTESGNTYLFSKTQSCQTRQDKLVLAISFKFSMLAVTCHKSLNSLACMDQLRKIISLSNFLVICSIMIQGFCAATDTINSSQTIRDGETMISSGGNFELGFFSPGNSGNRYVGTWYKNIPVTTVVWVANRESPLQNRSGALKITEGGLLVILDNTNGSIIWSSNRSSSSLQNPVAKLQDSGNLIVKDANDDDDNFLWQSFDYPTDTFIPGMHVGENLVTGEETYLSSWRNGGDPAPGDFTFHLDPTGYPQAILKRGNIVQNRLGPWNGVQFSGAQTQQQVPTFRMIVSINASEVMFRVNSLNSSVITRTTISPSGLLQRWSWNSQTQAWNVYMNLPVDNCDTYGLCGPQGSCNIETASCECLDYRFVPKDSKAWLRGDWSGGCVRRTNLSCQGDVFLKYSGIKMPDARYSWFNESMTLGECREECLRNCSCMAYTQLDIGAGRGCLFYPGDLVDIRDTSPGGQEIYIRMASSELESQGKTRKKVIAVLVPVTVMVLLGLSIILYLQRRKRNSKMRIEEDYRDSELPLFRLSTILKATNYFSFANKVGEGGFGPVYKGKLEGGQEIAVKKLSRTSSQGLDEFKNEVILIAKLQHRNLVRLLGCCIEGEESMLVYEYMPNKSLDVILFDKSPSVSLDWSTRFQIINGIARGLLYLHQDSRLRIIHRDLKASNILLDADMNPKISDFGTARSFGGNETAAKTLRVIGTYGYMAPEYAVDGLFSVKSDVFSFGVLVLEIVSGRKNRGFTHSDHHLNLLGHAWTLYKQERSVEMVDAALGSSFDFSEALRSIHVGLLCVQKKPDNRPSMSSVVLMLANEGVLPAANQPGFYTEREIMTDECSTSTSAATRSTNEATITALEGR